MQQGFGWECVLKQGVIQCGCKQGREWRGRLLGGAQGLSWPSCPFVCTEALVQCGMCVGNRVVHHQGAGPAGLVVSTSVCGGRARWERGGAARSCHAVGVWVCVFVSVLECSAFCKKCLYIAAGCRLCAAGGGTGSCFCWQWPGGGSHQCAPGVGATPGGSYGQAGGHVNHHRRRQRLPQQRLLPLWGGSHL